MFHSSLPILSVLLIFTNLPLNVKSRPVHCTLRFSRDQKNVSIILSVYWCMKDSENCHEFWMECWMLIINPKKLNHKTIKNTCELEWREGDCGAFMEDNCEMMNRERCAFARRQKETQASNVVDVCLGPGVGTSIQLFLVRRTEKRNVRRKHLYNY